MKILIATPLFPPDIGGPATYAKLLSEELPKRDVQVEILAFKEVRSLPKIVRHFAYFLRCIGKGRDCNLIYALDPVSVGLPAWLSAKLSGKRFMLKVVGDFAWEQYQQMEKSKIKNQNANSKFKNLEEFQVERFDRLTELRKFVERFVAGRAEQVIVPSEYLKKIILMWGVPEEKIKVVYNAFNPPANLPRKDVARGELGIAAEEKIIISAGRLLPWKGFAVLIEVFAGLSKNFPNTKLLIAGNGPELRNLQQTADNLQFGNKVKFLGQLSQSELHKYIVAADAFVLNTGYEGLSHLLLEVMALGTPIITTPTGGNPEILQGGQSAIFVEYNDRAGLAGALSEIISKPEKAGPLAAKARESLAKFSARNSIDGLIQVISPKI